LVSWDRGWRRSDWRVRRSSTGLLALGCIAVVSNSTLIGSTADLNSSTIAPVGSPGILDQPVVNSIFSSIPVNQNSVVDFLGGATREDAIGVVSKSSVTSIQVRNSSSIFSNLKNKNSNVKNQ
jgi:hypothetical protein